MTTCNLSYLQPAFSGVAFLDGEYSRTVGRGNLILGVRFMIDILSQSYIAGGYSINCGRSLCVLPVIGYSIPVIIHDEVIKQEKKQKRIDIIVN